MGIKIRNLTKRFPPARGETEGLLAVDDVSFAVPEGHLVALLGPSGSGKSTILRAIAGLEIPDAGTIELEGRDVTGVPAHRRGIGFVFQHYALFRHATVRGNIAFGLEVRRWPREAIRGRVAELLDLVQLVGHADRYPAQLSGGQRQRVALARALAPRPSVLLLDEPFGALDAKVRRNLAAQLRQLHDEVRTTTVFVTHDQEEAIEIADEIVVLNRGRVEQTGTAEEIYDGPATRFVASFIGNVNVIEGRVEAGGLRLGPRRVPAPDLAAPPGAGEVVLLVRPEDLAIVAAAEGDAGAAGTLPAEVRGVHYRGDRFEIDLDLGGLPVRAIEPKQVARAAARRAGERVRVRFLRHSVFETPDQHVRIREQMRSLGYME